MPREITSKFHVFETDFKLQTTILHTSRVHKAAACSATIYTIHASKGWAFFVAVVNSYLSCMAIETIQYLYATGQQKTGSQ